MYEASVPLVAALPNRESPEYKAALANEQAVVLVEMEYLRLHTPPATPREIAEPMTDYINATLAVLAADTSGQDRNLPAQQGQTAMDKVHAACQEVEGKFNASGEPSPSTLKPAEAQAANASAPSMVAETAAQAPSGTASSTAAATCAVRAMWAPLAATVAEDEVTRQALNAGGGRRIAEHLSAQDRIRDDDGDDRPTRTGNRSPSYPAAGPWRYDHLRNVNHSAGPAIRWSTRRAPHYAGGPPTRAGSAA